MSTRLKPPISNPGREARVRPTVGVRVRSGLRLAPNVRIRVRGPGQVRVSVMV
jgi:hypothetical protein